MGGWGQQSCLRGYNHAQQPPHHHKQQRQPNTPAAITTTQNESLPREAHPKRLRSGPQNKSSPRKRAKLRSDRSDEGESMNKGTIKPKPANQPTTPSHESPRAKQKMPPQDAWERVGTGLQPAKTKIPTIVGEASSFFEHLNNFLSLDINEKLITLSSPDGSKEITNKPRAHRQRTNQFRGNKCGEFEKIILDLEKENN